ncbi:MAG: tetratricopeptide repeat protein [Archangium sp.]|nr:tetratricopeptide repeat protein [Archangium sp.]
MNWLGRRNWVEAERTSSARLAEVPEDEGASVDLAEALQRQGRLDEALGVCEAALARSPSPQLFFSRAQVQAELGQSEAAEASLASAVQLIEAAGTDDAECMFVASKIASRLGYTESALATAHRSVILDPQQPRFLAHLGRLLIDSDAPLAEQRLRQSLKLDPEQAEVQNNLGAAALQQKKSDEAYGAFKAALELAPGYTLAATNLWGLEVAKRRRSMAFPLQIVPLLGATWLAWTAASFGSKPQIDWPRMGAALALMLFGISVGALADRLRPRDALSQKIHIDMNEGRLGHQQAVPVLRFFSHLLLGFGLSTMLGCAIGEVFVAREYLESRGSSALLGMGLLLAGIAVGAVLVFESRNLRRRAARLQANRS